jgi:twinkle protein
MSLKMRLVICHSDAEMAALRGAGLRSVRKITSVEEIYKFVPSVRDYQLDADLEHYNEIILALPAGMEQLRDDLAARLGDMRCRWVVWPTGAESAVHVNDDRLLANLASMARPMWTDEICTIDDIPEPGAEQTYASGFPALDSHGFRLVRPAFMPVIGPYGSGKSVLLRQLAVNLWRQHKWRTLITSFEERVKPRYERDFRRHLIGHNSTPWTATELAHADAEIRQAFRFLRRKRNTVLDMDRFLDRVEYAVKIYGVDVVMLDPVNELDHQVAKSESKTDYMGRFIMRLKQLADDYNLLMIAAAHPPKDGVEKRLSKTGLLTLNDGADTAHYGNKADIGWCVWRNIEGPTYLHIDKLKDHETMGKPTLAELVLDETMNAFEVRRVGYDIFERA